MKKIINVAWLLANLMMAAGDNHLDYTPDTRKCGQCKHGKKSFCKLTNHHITKNTPVNYCNHFELCE